MLDFCNGSTSFSFHCLISAKLSKYASPIILFSSLFAITKCPGREVRSKDIAVLCNADSSFHESFLRSTFSGRDYQIGAINSSVILLRPPRRRVEEELQRLASRLQAHSGLATLLCDKQSFCMSCRFHALSCADMKMRKVYKVWTHFYASLNSFRARPGSWGNVRGPKLLRHTYAILRPNATMVAN